MYLSLLTPLPILSPPSSLTSFSCLFVSCHLSFILLLVIYVLGFSIVKNHVTLNFASDLFHLTQSQAPSTWVFFEIGFCYAVQAGLELTLQLRLVSNFLPQPPTCWGYRGEPPHQATTHFLENCMISFFLCVCLDSIPLRLLHF